MAEGVRDVGESEGSAVMAEIGAAQAGIPGPKGRRLPTGLNGSDETGCWNRRRRWMVKTEPTEGREPMTWSDVDWTATEAAVRRLQDRIFRAAEAGDGAKVKNLQKLLVRSRSAKLLAIRQVT